MNSNNLIPRSILFGNPDKAAVRLSPDGKYISYLAPVNDVLNIWIYPFGKPQEAKPITKETDRGIHLYFWAYNSNYVLYAQDIKGDENWHIYSVNIKTLEIRDLIPFQSVQANIQQISPKFLDKILVGINNRDKSLHDIYLIDIISGELTLKHENEGFSDFVTDDDYNIRFAMAMTEDGGNQMFINLNGQWSPYLKISMEDFMTTGPAGFDKSGKILYMLDSRDRNTGALKAINLETNEVKLIAVDEKCDPNDVLIHPTEYTIQAVAFIYDRKFWKILDKTIKPDLEYLASIREGEMEIISRTQADDYWIIAYLTDDGPVYYYNYNRLAKKAEYLFSNRKELESLKLEKMHSVNIKSRDGLDLICYYTLPTLKNIKPPYPMVLDVHGGPWDRDTWGFNPYHQWLANRGYAVMNVNFRGSTGFGKAFVNDANLQWSKTMHDDLMDAVEWAIKEGFTAKDKIAIMGGSYGGYATLVGLTFTPDVFACGIDIVGPSNLITLLESIPSYWQPQIEMFATRVGDHRNQQGRKFLLECSPISYVDKIKKPLLIGQGANDPRVKQAEADQIVNAMKSKGLPVTYALFPDEGHGFAKPENRLAFNAITELFLHKILKGEYEPIHDEFEQSDMQIIAGKEFLNP
jgi:dipeptidyl aminopeptidase/acylaminoacyl peptidase